MRLAFVVALTVSPMVASAAEFAWRDSAAVPPAAADVCPLRHLDPYFWDYLENRTPPLRQHDWESLDHVGRLKAIREHCGEAAQIHDVFVDVKVRLDYALRMARGGEQLTASEKTSLIDRTLSETKGSAGMVEERLGDGSDLVMVLHDTRKVLQIERANLVARLGSEKIQDVQANGSLQGAGRVRVSGTLAEQKRDGDALFAGKDGRAASLDDTAVVVRRAPASGTERPVAGAFKLRETKYDSEVVRDVPAPKSVDPESATGKAFNSIRRSFKADPMEGYSAGERKYIQEQRDAAWLFPGWAESDAKDLINDARLNHTYCQDHPTDCRKNDAACDKEPSMQGCAKIRLRHRIFGN